MASPNAFTGPGGWVGTVVVGVKNRESIKGFKGLLVPGNLAGGAVNDANDLKGVLAVLLNHL